ncbi:hypothetical protein TRFO_03844 [Tritrichomonas foetus]|uniref:HMG box domain-containing protein n=1 Tax=Tritrichomonas foetus TaxID=1144522 RepID=A0A1J4KKH8_9EUKA|nr:hypothetical protein TRFO_03844 [Tritrichomonas foetus]|eukprot:OHT11642.1 hypothetical protein TRFO_03844 [Tritrichomonas foetus]
METLRGLCERAELEEVPNTIPSITPIEETKNTRAKKTIPGKKAENNTIKTSKNKFKRPPNAYVMFCNENRSRVRDENPELSVIEISKILSKMWKESDASVIEGYKLKAKESLEEFKKQNPNSKYHKHNLKEKKFPKKSQFDTLQVFNHLFQTNPFLLQQILVEKDSKGRPDVSKMFCID